MSLTRIQLPSIVLQDLFKYSLITLPGSNDAGKVHNTETLKTLGNNDKNILVLISENDIAFLPDDQLNFLLGVLSACNLSMNDVAIVNIFNQPADYKLLKEQLNPVNIILFGVTPGQIHLPLDFPSYQLQRFNNQVYLMAPALLKLQSDKSEKTKLWNCLKQLFSI